MAVSNPRLKAANRRFITPVACLRGLSSIAESAGDSVSALKAEIITEIAIVMANCLFSRPWIPLMKPTGMNTAARISAMLTTGPDTCSIAFSVASFGDRPSSM